MGAGRYGRRVHHRCAAGGAAGAQEQGHDRRHHSCQPQTHTSPFVVGLRVIPGLHRGPCQHYADPEWPGAPSPASCFYCQAVDAQLRHEHPVRKTSASLRGFPVGMRRRLVQLDLVAKLRELKVGDQQLGPGTAVPLAAWRARSLGRSLVPYGNLPGPPGWVEVSVEAGGAMGRRLAPNVALYLHKQWCARRDSNPRRSD